MAASDFWNDRDAAQNVVENLKSLKQAVSPLHDLLRRQSDVEVLLQLAEEENDGEALAEFDAEFAALEKAVERFELRCMLGGPHDLCNAYLSVQAGAGGTEACDWADMLLRMYIRWGERNEFESHIIEYQPGDEAGARHATLHVLGRYAYGYLRAEVGVHRLVRISPFDAANRRHTSFAAVDVTPEVGEDIQVDIRPEDLRVDTYRASGAGGQHVNKTSSAVRITYLPTGIVVQCQQERSQLRNRKMAMNMLRAKLLQLEERKRQEELARTYDEKGKIEWGNQIRSYVLQPYQLVKDLRTNVETGNVQAVLDGDINPFIEAYLKQRIGRG